MTRVIIYKNGDDIRGFECLGHSGYADCGDDVVCAGVSALTINTVNAIDQLTGQRFLLDTDEKSGWIKLIFDREAEHDAALLVRSMVLGLQGILNDYGRKFIDIEFKEV